MTLWKHAMRRLMQNLWKPLLCHRNPPNLTKLGHQLERKIKVIFKYINIYKKPKLKTALKLKTLSTTNTFFSDAAVVQTPQGIDEATNDKMDSDDSKGKVEG